MTLRKAHRLFLSPRSTVFLLCLLALLLLLNVMLPQTRVLGDEGFEAMLRGRPVARFFLADLGMGDMSTSPVFLTVLGLFFLNLALVLLARLGPTWRRIALRPRTEEQLEAWARLKESLSAPLPPDWNPARVTRTLLGFGYKVRSQGKHTLWGVKHRTAALGFLLFHLSFFLLFAGGALIYYTRFVGFAVLSEGQEFSGEYAAVHRNPPFGGRPPLWFTVGQIDPRFERGEPVHLGAEFHFRQAGATVKRQARVNAPAHWGPTSLLVMQAGLAPVFWVQDAQGFTLDRVVVPIRMRSEQPTQFTLGKGNGALLVHPLPAGTPFPEREDLLQVGLTVQRVKDGTVLAEHVLRQGEAMDHADGRIVLEELRYWVGVLVVSERGSGVLITGFVALVVGLIWRLSWHRREIALTWDEREFRLVGRSEYFSGRFREELRSIQAELARPGGKPQTTGDPVER